MTALMSPFPPLQDRLTAVLYPQYAEFVTACTAAGMPDGEIAQLIGPGATAKQVRALRYKHEIASGWQPTAATAARMAVGEVLGDTIEQIVTEQAEAAKKHTGGRARPEGSVAYCRACDIETTTDLRWNADEHPQMDAPLNRQRVRTFVMCPGSGRRVVWKIPAEPRAVAA